MQRSLGESHSGSSLVTNCITQTRPYSIHSFAQGRLLGCGLVNGLRGQEETVRAKHAMNLSRGRRWPVEAPEN